LGFRDAKPGKSGLGNWQFVIRQHIANEVRILTIKEGVLLAGYSIFERRCTVEESR